CRKLIGTPRAEFTIDPIVARAAPNGAGKLQRMSLTETLPTRYYLDPAVWEGTGHQANLVCRYHGWAFDKEGLLINARDFGADAPAGTCLTKVRAQSWRGFIFVCLDPTA